MANNTDFGARLKELREIIGISQVELAKKIGISQLTMSNYEMSKRFPDCRFFFRLRDIYQVNLNWLINGEGPIIAKYAPGKSEELAEITDRFHTLLDSLKNIV